RGRTAAPSSSRPPFRSWTTIRRSPWQRVSWRRSTGSTRAPSSSSRKAASRGRTVAYAFPHRRVTARERSPPRRWTSNERYDPKDRNAGRTNLSLFLALELSLALSLELVLALPLSLELVLALFPETRGLGPAASRPLFLR